MANGILIGALEFYGDSEKYSGDPGTVTNPYCISDIKDLKACGKLTTISNYILTEDINFREYNRMCDGNFYIPIDEYFDFNGFAFWNLNIRCMDASSYESYYNVFNFNCLDTPKDRYIKKCKLVNFIYNNNYSCILFNFDYKSSTIANSSVYFDDADISMHIIQHIRFYSKYAPLISINWGNGEENEKLFLRNSVIKLSGREEVDQTNYTSMVSQLFENYSEAYTYMYDCTIIMNDYKIVIMGYPSNNGRQQSFFPFATFTDSVIFTGSVIFELSDRFNYSSQYELFYFFDIFQEHRNINTLIDCNFTFINNNKEKYPNFYIKFDDTSYYNTPIFINKDKFGENITINESSDNFYLLNTEQLKDSNYLIGMGLMIDNEGELP